MLRGIRGVQKGDRTRRIFSDPTTDVAIFLTITVRLQSSFALTCFLGGRVYLWMGSPSNQFEVVGTGMWSSLVEVTLFVLGLNRVSLRQTV